MNAVSINKRVEDIKNNQSEINKLVEEYKPFIAACVEKSTGRYMRYGEDDELSIALMAFVEAINSYDGLKGSFLSLAQNVIKRRLIDYYRKEKKNSNVILLNQFVSEDEEQIDLSTGQSMENYTKEEINEYRRLELEELKKELKQWDITFMELAEASPKHTGTRKSYTDVIKYLLTQPELIKFIKNKKYLPIAEIEKATKIPRKKIERARKYIIAVILIETGDYQYIKEYINWG